MWARDQIGRILDECYEQQGWTIPPAIRDYQCQILTQRLDRPNWQPQPSYAEQYLTIASRSAALALAETCWFTRAVFPELGERKGLSSSYYVDIGQRCYDRVLKEQYNTVVELMRDHFEFLAECTYTAIRMNGEFRSMWD